MLESSRAAVAPLAPMRQIVEIVAAVCGITTEEITGPRRDRRICYPRQLAMALCLPGRSLHIVGRFFGRDHTTVLHARRDVDERLGSSAKWKALHDRIHLSLTSPVDLDGKLAMAESIATFIRACQPKPQPGDLGYDKYIRFMRQRTHAAPPPPNPLLLSERRRRERAALKLAAESCGQVGKFCKFLGMGQ